MLMRKIQFIAIGLVINFSLFAQVPDDVLRYGFPLMGGTARNMAIGGAMGSLGGDISAAHINPAGIGLFKNKELVLTPGFNFINNKFAYQGTSEKSKDNVFGYGTSGIVLGHGINSRYRKSRGSAFAFTINNLANYRNSIQYNGANNQSSWSEQYVEQLVRDRASIDAADNNYIFGSSLAFRSFLVDTLAGNNSELIGYQSLVPVGGPGSAGVQQINRIDTRGTANEVALSFGNNLQDKVHLGVSVGIPFYSFEKEQLYTEEDLSGNTDNDFGSFEIMERYRTTGVGFNLKAGLIFRPIQRLRLGFAFHTPTWTTMRDEQSADMTTDSEGYIARVYPNLNLPSVNTITSAELKGTSLAGEYEYNIQTPYRLIGSFSYVLNEVKDARQQKGFITADVEYVNYRGTRFSALYDDNVDDVLYYDELNDIIKERFKGAFNFKVGGELKFNTIMARLGFAHFGSPYADSFLKNTRTLLSGGLGYRYGGVFIDATYVHGMYNNTQVVYFLEDKPSPVADGRITRGQVVVTVGFKL